MLARTDLNLGSALVCLLIGGVLLAIVWVIDRRQLRRQEAEATGRHAAVTVREDQRLARADRGVRDVAGATLAEAEVPTVEAQDLEPTGEIPTRFIKVRPLRPAAAPTAADPEAPAERIVVGPTPVAEPAPPAAVAARAAEPTVEPEPVVATTRPVVEPEPVIEPEPVVATTEPVAPVGPIVTFTAHAQGAKGVRFLDPAAVIDLTDEHAAVRPAATPPAATPPAATVEPEPTSTEAPPASAGRAAAPTSVEQAPAPAPAAAPTPAAAPPVDRPTAPVIEPADPQPIEAPVPVAAEPTPAAVGDHRVRRRRGRKGRIDEPTKPKLPKGAEAALAAMVEVVPDPRNTVKTTRDPTAEVLLKKAERRAIDEARAYRPPAPDPVEWETPTEARVQVGTPASEHAAADS
ncbi:MAG: hypothetical protein R2726_22255 [Acidimicrobiales bacterium]